MRPWRNRVAVAVLSGAAVAGGFFGGAALLDHVEFAQAESDVAAGRQALSQVEDLSSVFREVARVVAPSVVRIDVTKTVKVQPEMDQDLLRKFLHDNGGDQLSPQAPDQEFEQDGTGSGVIMETGGGYGYILTNNHVAGGADDIKVTLGDGRVFEHGRLMGADAKTDLAIVRIKADNLIPARWGNSDDLQTGDWVLAFGAPLGFAGTMTHGIVSALNRNDVDLEGEAYENFIQVDAPINPGNSGGPLVNIHGEVVGINTAIASKTGVFSGIGFAIPANRAHKLYSNLKSGAKIVRGWLGIGIRNVSDDVPLAQTFGYDGKTGILVRNVYSGTPADGKLINGDIITAYDGTPVANVDELRNAVAETAPGTVAKLTVFRDDHSITVALTIGTQPEDLASVLPGRGGAEPGPNGDNQEQAHAETLGLRLRSLTPELAQQLNLDTQSTGAVISNVAPGSIASRAGLRPGLVITNVGRKPVANAREAYDALSRSDIKRGIRLTVLTSDGSDFVVLQEGDTGSDN